MSYDVDRIRAHFPALAEGAAHFDGPGGSQVPDVVGAAVAATLTAAIANRGTVTRAEQRAEEVVVSARAAMADLLGAEPDGIVFGRSATALCYEVSRALAKGWDPQTEVVVSRLDHDSNIRPWIQAAQGAGATVRWAEFDRETAWLDVSAVAGQLTDRTALVAVTGASNLLGTRPDLALLAKLTHEAGALLYVDAVHLTPHAFVDVEAVGADFFTCSPYKFLGPHLGALAARADLLDTLHPDKLLASSDAVPERFEFGTLPYELLAGTTAAVDFLAGLDDAASGERRERLRTSMTALEEYEHTLFERLLAGLAAIDGVRLYGRPRQRTPTVLFGVAGRDPQELYRFLAARGVNAPAGSFYALEASRALGLGDGGAVRAGLAPYTNADDVSRLVDAVGAFVVG